MWSSEHQPRNMDVLNALIIGAFCHIARGSMLRRDWPGAAGLNTAAKGTSLS